MRIISQILPNLSLSNNLIHEILILQNQFSAKSNQLSNKRTPKVFFENVEWRYGVHIRLSGELTISSFNVEEKADVHKRDSRKTPQFVSH